MRGWRGLGAVGVVLAAVAGCAEPTVEPGARIVGVSYQDVVDPNADWRQLDARLADVGATGVAVTAGRVDWTTFRWRGREDCWAAPLQDTDRDPFGDVVAAVGGGREVSAVVDVFAPGVIEDDPGKAATDEDGERSTEQVSIAELTHGDTGRLLVEMTDVLAARPDVDVIDLTELHYDRFGFGDADLALYRAATGEADWPRTPDGRVDLLDAGLGAWRSAEVGSLVERIADAVHAHGKRLDVDVRVSWDDLGRNSRDNGQDYEVLLRYADRLVVWNYFGLVDRPPSGTAELAEHLESLAPGRFVMSVGLWGKDDEPISPGDMRTALRTSIRNGARDTWVTPTSMLDTEHWAELRAAWRPGVVQ